MKKIEKCLNAVEDPKAMLNLYMYDMPIAQAFI